MLTPEDGSGVEGANSFVTLAQIRSYALQRGTTMSADDSVVEVQATKAMDYIASMESTMQGSRTSASQALSFPRAGVQLYGSTLADSTIPQTLKDAQCALCMVIASGAEFMALDMGKGQVISETVGEIDRKYASNGRTNSNTISSPLVDSLLAPLQGSGGAWGFGEVVRV